jgi:hypothetical protein
LFDQLHEHRGAFVRIDTIENARRLDATLVVPFRGATA